MTSYFEVNKIPVGTLLNIQIVQPIVVLVYLSLMVRWKMWITMTNNGKKKKKIKKENRALMHTWMLKKM